MVARSGSTFLLKERMGVRYLGLGLIMSLSIFVTAYLFNYLLNANKIIPGNNHKNLFFFVNFVYLSLCLIDKYDKCDKFAPCATNTQVIFN